MRLHSTPESKVKLSEALRQMSEALDILDELEAPGEIGTSLDLAIARLERFLGRGSNSGTAVQCLFDQLERELAAARECLPEKAAPWGLSPN